MDLSTEDTEGVVLEGETVASRDCHCLHIELLDPNISPIRICEMGMGRLGFEYGTQEISQPEGTARILSSGDAK